MKQLDKLLFEQGGDCFFCQSPLEKADASIEHLYAQANGGTNAEENVVACCKALNALLGSKPLKEKFQIVLRQRGPFRCPVEGRRTNPSSGAVSETKATAHGKGAGGVQGVASNPPGPRLVSSKSVAVPAKQPHSVQDIVAPTQPVQCPTCKHMVSVAVGQTDYVCRHCGGAFRY